MGAKIEQVLVARWNGNSAWFATYTHPVHGNRMDIRLNAGQPQPIESFWLGCPAFRAIAVEGEDNYEEGKIAYWYADKVPVLAKIDYSDLSSGVEMTPDLRETLRQVVLAPKFTDHHRAILSVAPGPESSITQGWASEVLKPFLKRVIEEERKFRNRPEVVEVCETTLSKIRDRE